MVFSTYTFGQTHTISSDAKIWTQILSDDVKVCVYNTYNILSPFALLINLDRSGRRIFAVFPLLGYEISETKKRNLMV